MIKPDYITLSGWADSLIIDFPADNIPVLVDEKDWKEWGQDLIQSQTFEINEAPSPSSYDEWNSWANAVYFSMNNNP